MIMFLYNAKGQGNLNQNNLDGFITMAKGNAVEVFVILDNEANAGGDHCRTR